MACEWIDRWDQARKRGDRAVEQKAEDAMQNAKHWKILEEMKRDGAWTQVLIDFADAMRGDGLWAGARSRATCRKGSAAAPAETC